MDIQFYSDRTWDTRAWIDGRKDPQIEQWCNVDEAIAMAQAGMKHANADCIARLDIVGTRWVDDQREETVLHRWKQDFKTGTFRHTINDGTEIL